MKFKNKITLTASATSGTKLNSDIPEIIFPKTKSCVQFLKMRIE